MNKNIPTVCECEINLKNSLSKIREVYKNSKCGFPKRCEEVFLVKELSEVKNYSKITGNPEYQELTENIIKKYNKQMNRRLSLNKKTSLRKAGLESTIEPLPEKEELRAIALLSRATQDPDSDYFSIV